MNGLRLGAIMLVFCSFSAALCQAAEKSRLVANLESGKQQTIVTYGTSITADGAWVEQLQMTLDSRYPGRAKIINSGKRGTWSTWGVDNLNRCVIEKKPDLVFIEFAINDAYLPYNTSVEQAEENLENMIHRILKSDSGCEIVLMTMTPPVRTALKRRPGIKAYYQMYRDVAKSRGLLLIDHSTRLETILKQDPELFMKYVPDGLHPGPDGCKEIITPGIVKALGIK